MSGTWLGDFRKNAESMPQFPPRLHAVKHACRQALHWIAICNASRLAGSVSPESPEHIGAL